MVKKVEKTQAQWRAELPDAVYRICREKGTEPPFTGVLLDEKREGVYHCAACRAPLFDARRKYDSGSGWPSYWAPIADDAVEIRRDTSHGMIREEAVCAQCGSHLGHRFSDGPQPTGQRYCINSLALGFEVRADTDAGVQANQNRDARADE